MSHTVTKVNEWEKDGKVRYYVDFEDGSSAVCFSEKAKDLEVGKQLPEGWELDPPKQEGWKPMLKAPKAQRGFGGGGGMAAFRNTKEGQAIEQQHMDRRTALMQAVALVVSDKTDLYWSDCANKMYEWIRSGSPLSGQGEGAGGPRLESPRPSPRTPAPQPSPVAAEGASSTGAAQGELPVGEGEAPAGSCTHSWSPLKPDGSGLPAGFGRCIHCGLVQKGALK
jgi:hypothetical protein